MKELITLEDLDLFFQFTTEQVEPLISPHFPIARLKAYQGLVAARVQHLESIMPLDDEQMINNWVNLIEDAAYLQDAISNQLAIYLTWEPS